MGYIIMYANCPIIWAIWLQTEIVLSTTESEYIPPFKSMRDVLSFVSLMKDIEFVPEIQQETLKVMFSLKK